MYPTTFFITFCQLLKPTSKEGTEQMEINIYADQDNARKYYDRDVEIEAVRVKHGGFDVFKLHGTDQRGGRFEIKLFIAAGQQIKQSIREAFGDNVEGDPARDETVDDIRIGLPA